VPAAEQVLELRLHLRRRLGSRQVGEQRPGEVDAARGAQLGGVVDVGHQRRDRGADARVAVRPQDGLGGLDRRRRHPQVVEHRGRAAQQHLYGAGQRGAVVVVGRVPAGGPEHPGQPHLQRQAVARAAQAVLGRVGVGVDQSGKREQPSRLQDRHVRLDRPRGLDAFDPVPRDRDVDAGAQVAGPDQRVAPAQEEPLVARGHG
jgi:hypothetical protein